MLLPPVDLFRTAANAAFAASHLRPETYLVYHVVIESHAASRFSRTLGGTVSIATSTGIVHCRIDGRERNADDCAPFGLAANFDALAEYTFAYAIDPSGSLTYVRTANLRPMTYVSAPSDPTRKADLVFYSLKGYRVVYDAATQVENAPEFRLRFTPIDEPHRRTIHLSEASIDAPTTLPRSVALANEFGAMTFTYAPRNDVLALQRFHFTYLDPIAHTRESIDARYDAVRVLDADPLAEAADGS